MLRSSAALGAHCAQAAALSCSSRLRRLRVASMIHQGTYSFSISSAQYHSDKYIAALNLEKAPGSAGHTGVNTRRGSQVTLHFKNIDSTKCKYAHVILHCDQVVSASAAGVELMD